MTDKPWEAMYRALVRRLAELAVQAETRDRNAIVRSLVELANCHVDLAARDVDDFNRAQVADRLEMESLQPTPRKQ